VIALGAMTFGGQTSARDAETMLGLFLDEGHSWVDTAFMYTDGRSERILGRLLRGARRERVFLATKAYPDKLGEGKPRGLTPASVRGQLETSLKRLRLDGVDLFYLHAPDNRTPLETTLAECDRLRQEGKFRELGLSNYPAWQAAEAVLICERNGWPRPTVYQGMYNALTRDVERECIVACRHFGLRFVAYNPLAGGLLTGKHASIQDVPKEGRFSGEHYRARFWRPEYFEAVRRAAEVCRRRGITIAGAALHWLRHHSMADGLLLGASRVEHLKENLAACRGDRLPASVVRAFGEAWETTRPACQRYFRD
jgi:aflatoxin B1 aldehyde reductase